LHLVSDELAKSPRDWWVHRSAQADDLDVNAFSLDVDASVWRSRRASAPTLRIVAFGGEVFPNTCAS
jgi:hypothetical protein